MSESRNGSAVPYTAYRPRRSQGQVPQVPPAVPSKPTTSRPTSFIAGDFFDNARNMFGDIVKGAEDMSQEIFGPNSPNGFEGSALLSNSQNHYPAASANGNGNGYPHSTVSVSPSPSSSLPRTVSGSPSPSTLSPLLPRLVLDNELPSPPASEPDMDSESESKNADNDSLNDGNASRSTTSDNASASSSILKVVTPTSSPGAGSSKLPPSPTQTRKTTSFRHIPRSSPLNPNALAHSRTASTSSSRPNLPSSSPSIVSHRHSSLGIPSAAPAASGRMASFASSMTSVSPTPSPSAPIHDPPRRADSLQASPQTSRGASPAPGPSPRSISPVISPDRPSRATSPAGTGPVVSPTPSRASTMPTPAAMPIPATRAPYRPGFQPKGVYRPRTDDFLALRRQYREGTHTGQVPESQDKWDTALTRVERTKLERRLEKIIALHFPAPLERPQLNKDTRRNSSFFGSLSASFSSTLSSSHSSMEAAAVEGRELSKAEIRTAEQRITPWENDSQAKSCWICETSFHPLTNRKHHCRLCGRIVCALPVSPKVITPAATEKNPQPTPRPLRPVKCSSLFVADTDTRGKRKIDEVGEGVDYGVKRHKVSASGTQQSIEPDDDRFLKGVRVCRACRPVLLRMQYSLDLGTNAGAGGSPQTDLERLYEALLSSENEIEEQLPMFHELLSSSGDPLPELHLMRKNLLESFTHYDALAKKIGTLSPKSTRKGAKDGPTSQERVQGAIVLRARQFMEKNMFPLKKALSASTPKSRPDSAAAKIELGVDPTKTAAEKKVYDKLQPLLEQEALLETFVEQAQASRKFEDVKTLRVNLTEIRQEIERVMKVEGLDGRKRKKKAKRT